jgi:protein TonB
MDRNILTGNGLERQSGVGGATMRFLRTMTIAAACAAGMVAAHGQVGGDEPGGKPETSVPAPVSKPERISSAAMQGRLIRKVDPVYPRNASRMEARVVLRATIGKDGRVESVEAVQGPDPLRGAAIDAVKQWKYKPYLLNGEPVEVETTIVVEFHA